MSADFPICGAGHQPCAPARLIRYPYAMPRDLNADLETLRKVLDLAQSRQFEQAAQLAEKTLADGLEHPLLLNVAATHLEQQGRFGESLKLLERAVNIAPTDVGARNALSLCLQRLDRPAEALVHVDELLRQHPELPFAHANRGNALIALGALARGRESHLKAVELEPGNLAAIASLASIATHRGAHAEAREWAERGLLIAPGYPDAVLSLAAAEFAEGHPAVAEQRLTALIMHAGAGATDRARATGLLADVLDAQGRYAEAFEAYQTCNQALRSLQPPFPGSSAANYARGLCAALDHFEPALWPRGIAPAAVPAKEHVFLLGFPRTGTTLLEVVLDGHPDVESTEELELLTDGVMRYLQEPLDLLPLAQAREADLESLRAAYWQRVADSGVDVAGKVFIDKHPLNSLKLPLILRLFPGARILFAVRDPRDVVFSCFRRRFKLNPAMYEFLSLEGTAAFYETVMGFAHECQRRLGIGWHTVRYERLVHDFEREMAAVCSYVGLEWQSAMGDFGKRVQSRDLATPSTAQLSRGLVDSGIGQWRHYAVQLQSVIPGLEDWVSRYGATA